MAARLHMNTAMLLWTGSAVRVEEAFPDASGHDESDDTLHADPKGFQKHISPNTRLQIYWRDSNGTAHHVCARPIDVGEFEMIVDAEKPVRVGTAVVLNTSKSGFVGHASIQCCKPRGLNYKLGLYTLDSHAREL
jgi:hypothetical protein